MTTAAIICEFNPFHNGHKYLIDQTREKCDADYIVAFMSGDFVQRGAPAFCDKFLRAEIAVRSGVDAVFELPAVYATSAASDFAFGGASMANSLGCCDYLAFGSECGDVEKLRKAAYFLGNESPEFKEFLTSSLKSGLSYPAAVSKAAGELSPEVKELLDGANNTLGIEYIKALNKLDSKVKPFTVKRFGNLHDSADTFTDEAGKIYASGSFLRGKKSDGDLEKIFRKAMPESASELMISNSQKTFPMDPDDFTLQLSHVIDFITEEELLELPAVNAGIVSKIRKNRFNYKEFSDLQNSIHDKSLTYNAAGRLLVHMLLDIRDKDIDREEGPHYLRLLAMNKAASPLLKKIKGEALVPVITKMADFEFDACGMLLKDIYAATMYNKAAAKKFNTKYVNDITHSPVIVG